MRRANRKQRGQATDRVLAQLATASPTHGKRRPARVDPEAIDRLAAADLVARGPDGDVELTAAGRARLARLAAAKAGGDVDPFRTQHFALAHQSIDQQSMQQPNGTAVVINDARLFRSFSQPIERPLRDGAQTQPTPVNIAHLQDHDIIGG